MARGKTLYSKATKRWLKAMEIAKILFESEGYHRNYLEEIETFIRRKQVYSPKIREDLIPLLYKAARKKGVPMTRLVDQFIREGLNSFLARELISEGGDKDEPDKAINQVCGKNRPHLLDSRYQ